MCGECKCVFGDRALQTCVAASDEDTGDGRFVVTCFCFDLVEDAGRFGFACGCSCGSGKERNRNA